MGHARIQTDMGADLIDKLLRAYGVKSTQLLSTQKGYRNESHPLVLPSGEKLNLILYKSEPDILHRIKAANRVSNYLFAQGFPARRTIDGRIIQLRSKSAVKYGALYSYSPGETIPWEAYTMAHIKLLGKTMSDMHDALKQLSDTTLPFVADEYEQIIDRMQRYFAQTTVLKAIKTKLGLQIDAQGMAQLRAVVQSTKQLADQQVLHMDFVRGNILFDSNPELIISGILDFEKTAYGHPQFDVARTLAFLLVDCKYKTQKKIKKYFLQSGYIKRGKASYSDIILQAGAETLLESLITLFLLYDFYKFLRHNPYESLGQNEHFVRTKNILISRHSLASFDRIPTRV